MSTIAKYTDKELVELWEERAAVAEYDGGLSREAAELQAANEIRRSLPARRRLPNLIQMALARIDP